jgi:diguanylate cyclase (GGDEF)-like protein
MFLDKVEELERQLLEKQKEARYYKNLAKKASDDRLRETEELSKVTTILKEKIQIIENQRRELEELNQKIGKISITDELTGLLNRRGLMLQAKQVFQSLKRGNYESKKRDGEGETFVCVLLDIDSFKKINDTYGHLAGDKFLTGLSDVFLQQGIFREIDIIGRFGGDEFMFILPKCSERNALIPLEKLMHTIKNREFIIALEQTINITVSMGVSEYRREDNDIYKAIDRADEALYYAKEHGRDRIVLSLDANRMDETVSR